jgi:tight adherence protein B
VTLWLTLRSSKDDDDPVFVPLESMMPIAGNDPGLLSRAGARARRIGDAVARRTRAGAIDAALDRAGLAIRPGEFVVVSATGVVVGVTAGLVLGGLLGALLFGVAAAGLPRFVLKFKAASRRRAFADQLEGTLQTIAGSLRAGYGLVQAISTVATESPEPTSSEFDRVVVESRLGRSVEDSLRAMARRLDDEDFMWVVEAIEIQREVGGNLAEVLDTVTGTIRDRNMIRRQIHALSAEGRLSAYILIGLPFGIAGLIAVISPDYLSELTGSGVGRIMLGAAMLLMFLGSLWIRKIVRVEF